MSDAGQYDAMVAKMHLCVFFDQMSSYAPGLDKGLMVEPMSKRKLHVNNSLLIIYL